MDIDAPAVTQFVFHPRPEPPGLGLGGVATRTVSGDAAISGRLYDAHASRVLLIFFHGNGEIAADYDDLARFYTACGTAFWVVDYRGYGRSSGTPSYRRMFTDADALLRDIATVEETLGKPFDRIVVMGRSLGSASAIYLAAAHPDRISALVLDSPFADGPALIRRLGGPRLAATSMAGVDDNIDRIARVRQPCLILHGLQDAIIPVSDAEALYAACPGSDKRLLTIEGAGHNDLLMRAFETYFSALGAMIGKVLGKASKMDAGPASESPIESG
jgi:pimeloyl-ACP methyl ester carboxylesterase